jgi:hypothetical protein
MEFHKMSTWARLVPALMVDPDVLNPGAATIIRKEEPQRQVNMGTRFYLVQHTKMGKIYQMAIKYINIQSPPPEYVKIGIFSYENTQTIWQTWDRI